MLTFGLLFAVSCADGDLGTIEGRWRGEIGCQGGNHEVSLVLEVSDDRVSGDGFTRALSLDKVWRVSGRQSTQQLEVPCKNDTCLSTEECQAKGGQTCDEFGRCLGCMEEELATIVDLTLEDDNIQLVNPTMNLRRMGSRQMEGTVQSFCPEGDAAVPGVTLVKE